MGILCLRISDPSYIILYLFWFPGFQRYLYINIFQFRSCLKPRAWWVFRYCHGIVRRHALTSRSSFPPFRSEGTQLPTREVAKIRLTKMAQLHKPTCTGIPLEMVYLGTCFPSQLSQFCKDFCGWNWRMYTVPIEIGTLLETNIGTWKIGGWKMNFPLGWPIFRGELLVLGSVASLYLNYLGNSMKFQFWVSFMNDVSGCRTLSCGENEPNCVGSWLYLLGVYTSWLIQKNWLTILVDAKFRPCVEPPSWTICWWKWAHLPTTPLTIDGW